MKAYRNPLGRVCKPYGNNKNKNKNQIENEKKNKTERKNENAEREWLWAFDAMPVRHADVGGSL